MALSEPIPLDFQVAKGNSNRAIGTRIPANFDLHIPEAHQLRLVKWAPLLVEYGMEKLKALYPMDDAARDPGIFFWTAASSVRAVGDLTSTPVVTGESQIQHDIDSHILSPVCSIASRILFHLNSDPPAEKIAHKHKDIFAQTSDNGPPLWDTVIKLSEDENSPASKLIISILMERIFYALELKSLTAAPSSFFYHLACRAAANIFRIPKPFDYQTCIRGSTCQHIRKVRPFNTEDDVDVPTFFGKLDEVPNFDPNEEEVAKLLADIRMLNDDGADESGPLSSNDTSGELAKHPRVHVALAIMRTGAVSLSEDIHDDPVAASLAHTPRRISECIRDSAPSVEAIETGEEGEEHLLNQVDCRKYSYEGLPDDKHEVFILQQVT
jgi:hypothetical protein